MKRLKGLILVFAVVGSMAAAEGQPTVTITIDEIVRNDHIAGRVTGLTDVGRRNHKVVVYVKTDQWYVHPFAQGGDGKSWAEIATDGRWTIGTAKRGFSASDVAALVIPMGGRSPSTVPNVRDIANQAIVVKRLEGTTNYGDL